MAILQEEVIISGMRLRYRVALPPLTTNYGKGSEIIPCEECVTCFATIGRGAAMACKVNRNLPNQTASGIK